MQDQPKAIAIAKVLSSATAFHRGLWFRAQWLAVICARTVNFISGRRPIRPLSPPVSRRQRAALHLQARRRMARRYIRMTWRRFQSRSTKPRSIAVSSAMKSTAQLPWHDGNGDGMIARRGFNKPLPASYHQDRLRQAPVGHFFDAMTNGWGAMPFLCNPDSG